MTDLPTTLQAEQVVRALRDLGLHSDRRVSVLFEPNSVTVTEIRHDEHGVPVIAGNGYATVVTKIGVTRAQPEESYGPVAIDPPAR